MQIIFLKDIPRVGQRGKIKDVAPGFGNSLIARGLAEKATPKAIMELENKKKEDEKRKENEVNNFKKFLEKIKDTKISINTNANEKGVLFKSIYKNDVINEIKKHTDMHLKEENLEMDHIKNLGEHEVIFTDGKNKGKFRISITN